MRTLQAFNIAVVIRVEAYDADDAQATVNAFLQRDDGELDDGTAIIAWRFPVQPVHCGVAYGADTGGSGRTVYHSDYDMSIPGIPNGEVGRNIQKGEPSA